MPDFTRPGPPNRPEFDAAPDDLDRLFAHLERAPVPSDLTARVLASTVNRRDARAVLVWPWMLAGLGALGLLVLAGYQLGANLASSDGLALIEAVFTDLGLLGSAPGDVLAALGGVLPWPLIVVAGISAGLVVWAAGHIVSHPSSSLTARGRPVA
ncbi:MAG: hypothetical protein JOY61_21875 [Chloroflexi bacterium]|nr:hypothetical protein [Chloroflexota bacterium]